MSKVISAHAVSVDGYISGRTPDGSDEFGGALTSALAADLVDEVVLHQVPVLLGDGHSFFQEVPKHVNLRLLEAIPAPGVTHLYYEVIR